MLNQTAIINLSVANLRAQPAHASELVSQLWLGFPVTIEETNEKGWHLVTAADGYRGWLDKEAIVLYTDEQYENYKKARKLVVTLDFCFSKASVDKNGNHVSDLVCGNILTIEEEYNNYLHLRYPDGRNAYLPKDAGITFVSWAGRLLNAGEVVKTLTRYTGVPYLWGGNTVKGFDCSGLVQFGFYGSGILLPRDAKDQAVIGQPVSLDDDYSHLQEGDLLFFGEEGGKITHVALYMGNANYLHAAGRVRVNNLKPHNQGYDAYRHQTLQWARRVTPGSAKALASLFL